MSINFCTLAFCSVLFQSLVWCWLRSAPRWCVASASFLFFSFLVLFFFCLWLCAALVWSVLVAVVLLSFLLFLLLLLFFLRCWCRCCSCHFCFVGCGALLRGVRCAAVVWCECVGCVAVRVLRVVCGCFGAGRGFSGVVGCAVGCLWRLFCSLFFSSCCCCCFSCGVGVVALLRGVLCSAVVRCCAACCVRLWCGVCVSVALL